MLTEVGTPMLCRAFREFLQSPRRGMDRSTFTYTYTETAREMQIGQIDSIIRSVRAELTVPRTRD